MIESRQDDIGNWHYYKRGTNEEIQTSESGLDYLLNQAQAFLPNALGAITKWLNAWKAGRAGEGVPSRFGQIRGGIEKVKELTKSNQNLKLSEGKRIDLKGRHPLSKGHYNKITKEQLGYPHIYDPAHPGGVRAPNANDYIEIFNLFK